LRDGLGKTDRQRRVLVGAARQRLLDEKVPRHGSHRAEHALVADACLAQALDHARARALRGHADSGKVPHFDSHSRASGSCALWVRSRRSGVTETRPWSTAWKSVPGPASCAPPAGPIQYAVSPRGVCILITGSALCRLPRRVTSMPPSLEGSTSGTLMLSRTGSPSGSRRKRSTICSATP